MSDQVNETTSGVTPTTGVGETSEKSGGDNFDANTKIKDLAQLRKDAPELHKAMLEGIAFNIVNKMKAHADRMKKIMREARRQGK